MPSVTINFAVDSQVGPSGIPSDDTGRGNGWFSVGSGGDYGLGIKTFDGDTKYIQCQIVGVQKPNIYFVLDKTQLTTLSGLMAASQHIYDLTLTIVHKRSPLTINDTAPITVGAVIERGGPGTGSLETLYQMSITANDIYQTDTYVVPLPTHGTDAYFDVSELQTFEMGFYLLDRDGGFHPFANIYRIEHAYFTATYSTRPVTVGGASATGGAGMVMGSSRSTSSAIAAATGLAPELHLNQWGIEGFSLETSLEEHQ